MRINKKHLIIHIDTICEDILDNVVSPICEINEGIWADIFMATLDTYGTEEQVEEMVKKICKRYGLPSLDKDSFIPPIEGDMSLASLALYIFLYAERCKFYMIEECDFCGKHGSLICGPYDNLICLKCADKFDKGEIR